MISIKVNLYVDNLFCKRETKIGCTYVIIILTYKNAQVAEKTGFVSLLVIGDYKSE